MNQLQRVVAFANGKGGTGKTSCTANVGGLAAAAGWRTLLIELDSQGNLGDDLGYIEAGLSDDGAHIVTTLIAGGQLEPVLSNVRPNLDVIPGGIHLDDLDDVVSGRERRRAGDGRVLLRNALQSIAGDYDLILLDSPPARRSPLVLLSLEAARWLVIPTKSDRSSIKGLGTLAEQVVTVRETNPDLEVLGALLFAVGSSATVVRRNAAKDVCDVLGSAAPLFDAVIRHAEAAADDSRDKGRLVHELAEVVADAEPYWKALKEGRRPQRLPGTAPALAEDYVVLAQEILARIAAAEAGEGVQTA